VGGHKRRARNMAKPPKAGVYQPYWPMTGIMGKSTKRRRAQPGAVDDFANRLGALLEEPEEALGLLHDLVNRGRMQAHDAPSRFLHILREHELIAVLVQKKDRQPLRTWVYPTPLGLQIYATLERAADRHEAEEKARARLRHPRW